MQLMLLSSQKTLFKLLLKSTVSPQRAFRNLPALCAFSMPNFDSYHRLRGFRGTVGTWVGWGTEDKNVAIRKISERTGYWEIRCAD
jgi:glutamine synthetase